MSGAVLAAVLVAATSAFASRAVREQQRGVVLARAGKPAPSRRSASLQGWRLLGPAGAWLVPPLVALAGLGIGSLVAGTPGGIAGLAGGVAAPILRRRRQAIRREVEIESQLAEAVASIAAGLRAGLSLTQALRFAADEAESPLSPELSEVVDRTDLGIPLGESLERWAAAEPCDDVRLVASVLQLHHRTGGNLPAVLDQLSRTLRERRAAGREVRSLTAQARLSGAILGILPLGFFLFLSATSRKDIAVAYHSRAGTMAIAAGLALEAAAFVWIRRLLRVSA